MNRSQQKASWTARDPKTGKILCRIHEQRTPGKAARKFFKLNEFKQTSRVVLDLTVQQVGGKRGQEFVRH